MSQRLLILVATLGSVALFGGALMFQYLGGLAPCELCLLQRWPHRVAIVIGILALVLPGRSWTRLFASLGALTMLVSTGFGIYHTGVERHWWEGPSKCTSGDISNVATHDLLNQIMAAPLVHCDQVAWQMWGLSMASWNALISLLLAGIWLAALRRG